MKTAVVFPGLHGLHRVRRQQLTALVPLQHPSAGLLLDLDEGTVGQERRMKPYPFVGLAEYPIDHAAVEMQVGVERGAEAVNDHFARNKMGRTQCARRGRARMARLSVTAPNLAPLGASGLQQRSAASTSARKIRSTGFTRRVS